MADSRSEWVCDGCGVRCYKMGGEAFPRPEGWLGDRCLACVKEVESDEDRARRLVLNGDSTGRIARTCRSLTKTRIKEMRREAIRAGELDPTNVKGKPKADKPKQTEERKKKAQEPSPKRAAAEELLQGDPALDDKKIASIVGAGKASVGAWRRKLGIPNSKAVRRGELVTLLRAEPTLSASEVKRRLPHPPSSPFIGTVRRELGITPPGASSTPGPTRPAIGSTEQ